MTPLPSSTARLPPSTFGETRIVQQFMKLTWICGCCASRLFRFVSFIRVCHDFLVNKLPEYSAGARGRHVYPRVCTGSVWLCDVFNGSPASGTRLTYSVSGPSGEGVVALNMAWCHKRGSTNPVSQVALPKSKNDGRKTQNSGRYTRQLPYSCTLCRLTIVILRAAQCFTRKHGSMKNCLGLFAVHVRHGQAERLVVRRWAAHRVNACDRAAAVDRHSGNLLCSKYIVCIEQSISLMYRN